jgi:protein O-mannosyl-transferase
MNPEHKKHILENMGRKSPAQIASELNIRERDVKKVIQAEKWKDIAASTAAAPKTHRQPLFRRSSIVNRESSNLYNPRSTINNSRIYFACSIALIIILGLAIYANSLNGKFVYDDINLVENNTLIRTWPVSSKIFTTGFGIFGGVKSPFYRPIHILTYAIDYHLWKLNVVGYHLTNVILHILVALCIYWLINILFKDKIVSLLCASLFVIHPIHTTVVSYISSRAEELYLLFMLTSFIFYVKSLKSGSIIHCIIMALSYSLAFLSKENSLILPVLILLYHYTFREKIRPREFIPISGIALLYIVLRATLLKHLMTGVVVNGTLIQRIPGFFVAIATYVKLLFLPLNLHIEYGAALFNLSDPKAIYGLLILAVLAFSIFKTLKTNKLIFFSLSWLLITLLPVSNLYPLNAYMSENWLYLPSIGFFLILAESLKILYKKLKIPALILTACLLAFYSYLTIMQNKTWAEPALFYERTLRYAPDSSKAYTNLGLIYYNRGDKENAAFLYRKAIETDPNAIEAYYNLGLTYNEVGEKEKSVAMYKKAIEVDPAYAAAYNNLSAILYNDMGKKDEAITLCRRAIELDPNNAEAYNNLAYFLQNDMSKKEEVLALYGKAIELTPDNAEIHNNLASAYYKMNLKEKAVAAYKNAIEINPHYAQTYNNLGFTYYNIGKKEEAVAMYKKAIEINPGYADAYNHLGIAYFELGRREEAIAAFKKVLEINPDHADARGNLEAISK